MICTLHCAQTSTGVNVKKSEYYNNHRMWRNDGCIQKKVTGCCGLLSTFLRRFPFNSSGKQLSHQNAAALLTWCLSWMKQRTGIPMSSNKIEHAPSSSRRSSLEEVFWSRQDLLTYIFISVLGGRWKVESFIMDMHELITRNTSPLIFRVLENEEE